MLHPFSGKLVETGIPLLSIGKAYTALTGVFPSFAYTCCRITSARKSRTVTSALLDNRGSNTPVSDRRHDCELPLLTLEAGPGSEGNA